MDKNEAREVLRATLDRYRKRGYADLVRLVDNPDIITVFGASEALYRLEIEAVWDDERGANLRVVGAVDNGGWRSFVPLTESFIVAPDGTFVAEQ